MVVAALPATGQSDPLAYLSPVDVRQRVVVDSQPARSQPGGSEHPTNTSPYHHTQHHHCFNTTTLPSSALLSTALLSFFVVSRAANAWSFGSNTLAQHAVLPNHAH